MSDELIHAENQIEALIRRSASPRTAESVIKDLVGKGLHEETLRAAVWFLIDGERIRLTENLRLVPA
jgi:hypothetical protein